MDSPCRAVFEDRFDELPFEMRLVKLGSLACMVIAFAALVLPATFHLLVERGDDSYRTARTASNAMYVAVPLFLVALAADVFAATSMIEGVTTGETLALALLLGGTVPLAVWSTRAAKRRKGPPKDEPPPAGTPIGDKIRHVLTEARMILPGAQALLGFQLVAVLTHAFAKLPSSSQRVHLASVFCVAVATMLLIAPAAYHRLVLGGEERPSFHRLAGRLVLCALIPLGLGLCGELFVVTRRVLDSVPLAITASAISAAILFGAWFGLPLAARASRPH